MITTQGNHLTGIWGHVEVWLLDKHCFIFEDKELIAAFEHHDKKDLKLMEHACLLYHKRIAPSRIKH